MTNHSGEWPAEAISLIGKQREEIERLQSLSHAVRLFIFAAKRDSWPVVDHGYFKRMEAALLDVQAPAEPPVAPNAMSSHMWICPDCGGDKGAHDQAVQMGRCNWFPGPYAQGQR